MSHSCSDPHVTLMQWSSCHTHAVILMSHSCSDLMLIRALQGHDCCALVLPLRGCTEDRCSQRVRCVLWVCICSCVCACGSTYVNVGDWKTDAYRELDVCFLCMLCKDVCVCACIRVNKMDRPFDRIMSASRLCLCVYVFVRTCLFLCFCVCVCKLLCLCLHRNRSTSCTRTSIQVHA
jgi:hypothetical protein